ncbi:LysM peptidoglycan-binding domain-containing protein [Acidovorax cavernicola]|uniref:LysM peptidoglycan-binding domain-containing protein n=2 Tax=Acidovorax cavernicola TaxID=1675792 RepID=A0A9X8D319_9BURK|nr:LysM peptidoglycan-binding domain-containing protein [Acidovorax cavernicola]
MVGACSTTPSTPVAGPGEYVVQPGDTLYRIAQRSGRTTAEIARWNQIKDPDQLEAGQVLRVVPPGGATAAPTPPPRSSGGSGGSTTEKARPAPAPRERDPVVPPASRRSDWGWPSQGAVIAGFNGNSNKGLDIGGSSGEPVHAIGAGSVAATETMRGYGSVIMVDHGGSYMSIYTNVAKVGVKQGQRVQRGQKIAEIGPAEGSGRARLHFEIRYRGKAVDPRLYLPAK